MKKITINIVLALLWPSVYKKLTEKVVLIKACLFACLLLLILNSPSTAQEGDKIASKNALRALKVGEKVPEDFWNITHEIYQNGKVTKQSLLNFRDKLLILDYWATWCSSCIIKFPEMQELQARFPDELEVLLVNPSSYKDEQAKIEALLNAKLPPFKTYTLPTVICDTMLIKLFEPAQLPQHIWIIDGYVRAITSSEFTDANSVAAVIANSRRVEAKRLKRTTKTN